MPIDPEKLRSPEPKRPTHPNQSRSPHTQADRETYQQQRNQAAQKDQSAIAKGINQQVAVATQSLSRLDEQLSSFEERYANSVVDRVAEMPTRIGRLINQKLQENDATTANVDSICEELDAIELPEVCWTGEQWLFSGDVPIASLPISQKLSE